MQYDLAIVLLGISAIELKTYFAHNNYSYVYSSFIHNLPKTGGIQDVCQ